MVESQINNIIQHDGVVERSESNSVIVKITSLSACSGCHAEGSCVLTGKEDKLVEISGNYNVARGDIVTVIMRRSMGYAALFFGYILPLLVVVTMLIILISFSTPELTAGLFSLAILAPYYLIMYVFRDKINRKFTFTIKT